LGNKKSSSPLLCGGGEEGEGKNKKLFEEVGRG